MMEVVAERDGCPVCEGLNVVRYERGQAPLGALFCLRCRRHFSVVEVDADERRRLASMLFARRQRAVARAR